MAGSTRNMDKVLISAEAAGLSSRIGPVQVLRFSSTCMSDEYRLLELPPKILEIMQQGDSLVIRGENQDDAVLCTSDATYDVKVADTSNSLLLLPQCQTTKDNDFKEQSCDLIERQVCSCHTEYLELRPGRPHLHKIHKLLQTSLYKGTEDESIDSHTTDSTKYTMDDLLNVIRASEAEVRQRLSSLGALEINGFWRLLDKDYKEQATMRILTYLEEMAWDYQHVPLDQCSEGLQELQPGIITEHCLHCLGERRSGDEPEADVYYELSEDKVCRFYAEYLLRPVGRFNYHEFMESWQQSVPDGMTTSSDHLLGISLTDMTSHPPVIWHFPSYDLPEDPELRFARLFRTRTKWTYNDIQPYISDLVSSGQSINALLMKFARSSKDDAGNKVYNSKKPV